MRRIGIMEWEQMNWLFPDFEDTNLLYHGANPEALPSIYQEGLVAGHTQDPEDQHHTIYDAHVRHRPPSIPDWVDPRRCIFGYLNRRRHGSTTPLPGGTVTQVFLGIRATKDITDRTWVCCNQFSDWVYCPSEAGYLDSVERRRYYETVIEPTCSGAYWQTSLSFDVNREIRHDQLLMNQGYLELLICVERVPPEQLSVEGIRIKGEADVHEVVRSDFPPQFQIIESRLQDKRSVRDELMGMVKLAAESGR